MDASHLATPVADHGLDEDEAMHVALDRARHRAFHASAMHRGLLCVIARSSSASDFLPRIDYFERHSSFVLHSVGMRSGRGD
jgi:hypothetical protein